MKIVHLTAHLSRHSGGFFHSVHGLASALGRCPDTAVEVVGLRDRRSPEDAVARREARTCACDQYGPRALGYSPGFARELGRISPDLVHSHGLWMYHSRANLHWSRRAHRPYVVSPRGMLHPWALRRAVWKKRIAACLYEGAHLRGATCLHATSATEARHFRAYGLTRPIAVLANGVDLPALHACDQARERSERTALFLSRIHPVKGLPLLVRAWRRVQERHPDWRLVVAGPDERGHAAEIRGLAAGLGARGIELIGPAYGEAKGALYAAADLFVLPTHSENFGLVVAEALAHGVPVITTTGAPWQGLRTERCGWWIELSEELLADALDAAMSLPEAERRAMGPRGRAWIERDFTWPAIARQMREVYEWVLGGGPPPACVMTD